MADVTRHDSSPAEWWLDEPEPKTRDTYTEDDGALALEYLAETLSDVRDAVEVQDYVVSDATRYLAERLDVQALVDTVAMVQDLRRSLAVVEAYVTREVGLLVQEIAHDGKAGQTSDGRPYEIMRGANRKAWDHGRWQTDVRRSLLATGTPEHVQAVNTLTGEEVPLREIVGDMLAVAQAIHGSAAPKVGPSGLKRLGLSADDYCETHPGPFAVKITTNRD